MRELDVLLTAFLEQRFPQADEPEKHAFRRLLALPDPDLLGYLLGGQTPTDPGIADVIERIRGHAST